MNVTLIHHTHDAAELLIFTKATRLNMTPALYGDIVAWPAQKKLDELKYMATTIQSSWEFVDLVFLVEGLSRAAAQQVTRTRTASFAMQSQRVTDMSGAAVVMPTFKDEHQAKLWDSAVEAANNAYRLLVEDGMEKQDARGVLPMNTECNLVVKYNLRAFADMLKARQSLRAQGEYVEMARRMKALVLGVWPWAEAFFESPHDAAIEMLETVVAKIGLTPGKGPGWDVAKAIDLLRKG